MSQGCYEELYGNYGRGPIGPSASSLGDFSAATANNHDNGPGGEGGGGAKGGKVYHPNNTPAGQMHMAQYQGRVQSPKTSSMGNTGGKNPVGSGVDQPKPINAQANILPLMDKNNLAGGSDGSRR